ncbi:MAG: hypothetical protein K0R24_815 [Gammaproteobacteria bacterium]|nr:hypothetical protein [Gammaproteobacteria bacterium]
MLLTFYLAISVTAHVIANRLVAIHGFPIISAGFIYMAVFVLTDVFASFNSRRLVILIISLEAIFNLFFIVYTNIISHMPYPSYFHGANAYTEVFSPVIILYAANLGGTFIAAVIDLFIFYYLYKQRQWMFFLASFFSSIITISCYTYVTDYFGFRHSYPNHVLELTFINLLTNFITLLFYSILGQILVNFIQNFLNGRSKLSYVV